MKAAFLTGIGEFEVRDMPRPQIESPDDVLLRIEMIGVCGSDMHYYRHGRIGSHVVQYPFVIGHECSAVVAQTGPEATRVGIGQRIVLDPLIACGKCEQCLTGRAHTCLDQKFLGVPGEMAGALVEYLVMPERCCFPAPEALTPERCVLLEPFPICLYAQRLAGDVSGKTAAVLGCGPIGVCVISALKVAGAGAVYATDIRDYRKDFAGRMGADWTGNPHTQDVVKDILLREPLGVDFAFECAGEQETIDQAVELLKPGGALILVGIGEFDRGSFDMETLRRKELRILNVRRQNECLADAIQMVASGKVNLDPLVTHYFPLERTQEAFDTVSDYADGVVKAMIRL